MTSAVTCGHPGLLGWLLPVPFDGVQADTRKVFHFHLLREGVGGRGGVMSVQPLASQ